jgi:hypothetical protein
VDQADKELMQALKELHRLPEPDETDDPVKLQEIRDILDRIRRIVDKKDKLLKQLPPNYPHTGPTSGPTTKPSKPGSIPNPGIAGPAPSGGTESEPGATGSTGT